MLFTELLLRSNQMSFWNVNFLKTLAKDILELVVDNEQITHKFFDFQKFGTWLTLYALPQTISETIVTDGQG